MHSITSCHFENIPEIDSPFNACVWNHLQYCDTKGWYSLPDKEKLALRLTKFDDKRLSFLDPVQGIPEQFKGITSDNYDVKAWLKDDCAVGVEGDSKVYIKLRGFSEVALYEHHQRLPAFTKNWKPIVFLANSKIASVRLTETIALILISEDKSNINVYSVDYNGGFIASDPEHDSCLVYGSFRVKGMENIENCIIIPPLKNDAGDWGFFIQFYTWGSLVIPKEITYKKSSVVKSIFKPSFGSTTDVIALLIIPPVIFLPIKLVGKTPSEMNFVYTKDYAVTAKQTSVTDVEIYLCMFGQLLKYTISYDIRNNKKGKPLITTPIKFRFKAEKDENNAIKSFTFLQEKATEMLLSQGSPNKNINHLVSDQLVAIFDASTGTYSTHAPALRLTKAFSKLAYEES